MSLNYVPASVKRFTAAITGEAKTVHDWFLTREDELLVHLRRDMERLLTFGKPPHVTCTNISGKIRLRQLRTEPEASGPDIGSVIVQVQ